MSYDYDKDPDDRQGKAARNRQALKALTRHPTRYPARSGTGIVLAFTGHRPNKLNDEYDGTGHVTRSIVEAFDKMLYETGCIGKRVTRVISGMALGVDQIAAVWAIARGIPVTAAIPHQGQANRWPPIRQAVYKRILEHELVTTHYVSRGGYKPKKMQTRNEWMVDHCDVLVAVWDGSSGGTLNCIRYANLKERPVYRIDPSAFVQAARLYGRLLAEAKRETPELF